jgi:transmembrane sensor
MNRQTAAQIEREATQWLMRIDREGRTPEVEAELEAWLAGDRRRRGAWLQAEAAWLILDRMGEEITAADPAAVIPVKLTGSAMPRLAEVTSGGRDDPFNGTQGHGAASGGVAFEPTGTGVMGHGLRRDDSRTVLSRRRLIFGGGAAIAASLAGGLFILTRPERFVTTVGEIRRIPLADGSTAAINTRSAIAVAMADDRRTIRLDQGEAWFQVVRDRGRPFVVEAGRVRVQAVGTAFAVRRRDSGADVLVTEGVVEAWADGAEGVKIRLAAGQRAFVADNAAIRQVPSAPSEVDRTLAWRSGRIDLAGETLGHAAEEFNRYNGRRIVIGDPRLADERFYGVFRTDDPEGFARAVHTSLEVPVSVGTDEIRIGR